MTEPLLFNAHAEPTWLPSLVAVMSAAALIAVFYAQSLATRVLVLYRFGRWIPGWVLLISGAALAALSYCGYTLFDLRAQAALAVITCMGLHAYVPKKSVRWININFAVFMLFVAAFYAYINAFISEVAFIFFLEHDLSPWRIDYKPFFKVFNPDSDVLFRSRYDFDGLRVAVAGDIDHLRSSAFLSGCVAFVSCFWSLIYIHVMRKHGFEALKAQALRRERRGVMP